MDNEGQMLNYYDNFIRKNPVSKFLFFSSTTLIMLIICLFMYMIIFEIDVVTSAYGKIIPEGKIKTIQPVIGGKILKIYVSEGQLVEADSLLVALDSTGYEHDLNSAKKDLELVERKIGRIKAMIKVFEDDEPVNTEMDLTDNDNGLYNEISSSREQIKELNDSMEANMLELKIIRSQIQTSEKNIDHIKYKIKTAKELSNKVIPKSELIELENKLENLLHEREKHNYSYHIKQKNTEIIQGKLKQLKSGLLFKSYYELDNLEKNRKFITESIKKLDHSIENMNIRSPISGYVENLKVNTEKGVVNSAEEIMNIVPAGARMKLEANLHSKDIGFIRNGQKVAIKFDAFPYTQYGTSEGKVCKISKDSFSSDNVNYFYKIDICLEKDYLSIKKIKHKITSGYTAQVDIYVDRRKIIDFFLAPVKIAISNSFKEK